MVKCEFASDNTAGILPEAWSALLAANEGYALPYGDDEHTTRAAELFRKTFETDCEVFFVFNGTAANSLALASLCRSYHSVIAHEQGHIETDECGGPEFFSNGTKILLAGGGNGKLDVHDVERLITKRSDIHYPRPRVLSLTQSTELGTVYTAEEIERLCSLAKRYQLRTHMDGARFGQAVARLKIPPKALTWEAGVDVLTFGGTKAGGISDAVVFFSQELAQEFDYQCKQAGQLASKMRFLAAPWTACLENNVWIRYADHANQHAALLSERLSEVRGIRLLYPTEANAVFIQAEQRVLSGLRERGWKFYVFIGGGARFMCSWKTTLDDIEHLVQDVRACADV